MSIHVLAPGLLTTVQDAGRHGHAQIGVGSAGAVDGVALRLANILVGNVDDEAALEITVRGPRLRFERACLIAITGAAIDARCADADVPMWRPVRLRAGAELAFGTIRKGVRAYLAVGGGIAAAKVLGSRSVDVNAGICGRALAAGDVLPTPSASPDPAALQQTADFATYAAVATKWSLDPAPWVQTNVEQPIHVTPGTHFSHLDARSQAALFDTDFSISMDSNRVGYRLEGGKLALREKLELVSAGVVPGTLQLPPNGAPIVLMAEAPTSGGYPRIAHVIATDLPHLAQRRPGDRIRFAQISLEDAQTRYLERERALAALSHSINERLHD